MPRNSGGSYSLPAGQPVVSGTTIDPTIFNNLTADLGTEITDSLDRSGKGAMLAALQLQAGGSAATPDLTWGNDADSGLVRLGANDIALAVAGATVIEATATTVTITDAVVQQTAPSNTTGGTFAGTGTGSGLQGTAGSTGAGVIGLGNGASSAGFLTNTPGVVGVGKPAGGTGGVFAGGSTSGIGVEANGVSKPAGVFSVSNGGGGIPANITLTPLAAAPTLHNDGDLWVENVAGTWHLKVRLNGATVTVV